MWRQSRRINLAESALIKREQDHTGFLSRVTFSMGQGPYGHLLATADGVATLRTMVASPTAIIPASIEETDEEFWQSFRRGARDLASAVPEFGKLVNPDATDKTLMAWRETVERVTTRLTKREEWLRKQEKARFATAADLNLVPVSPHLQLLVRYAAMNDRKIDRLLKLIATHCEKEGDGPNHYERPAHRKNKTNRNGARRYGRRGSRSRRVREGTRLAQREKHRYRSKCRISFQFQNEDPERCLPSPRFPVIPSCGIHVATMAPDTLYPASVDKEADSEDFQNTSGRQLACQFCRTDDRVRSTDGTAGNCVWRPGLCHWA
jgi:hypothetical protein